MSSIKDNSGECPPLSINPIMGLLMMMERVHPPAVLALALFLQPCYAVPTQVPAIPYAVPTLVPTLYPLLHRRVAPDVQLISHAVQACQKMPTGLSHGSICLLRSIFFCKAVTSTPCIVSNLDAVPTPSLTNFAHFLRCSELSKGQYSHAFPATPTQSCPLPSTLVHPRPTRLHCLPAPTHPQRTAPRHRHCHLRSRGCP